MQSALAPRAGQSRPQLGVPLNARTAGRRRKLAARNGSNSAAPLSPAWLTTGLRSADRTGDRFLHVSCCANRTLGEPQSVAKGRARMPAPFPEKKERGGAVAKNWMAL